MLVGAAPPVAARTMDGKLEVAEQKKKEKEQQQAQLMGSAVQPRGILSTGRGPEALDYAVTFDESQSTCLTYEVSTPMRPRTGRRHKRVQLEATPSWSSSWKTYALPGGWGDRFWFHNEDTLEFFLADARDTKAWTRYQDESERAWWWNDKSKEWFYE